MKKIMEVQLTLEQRFSISKFNLEVEKMTEQQAKEFLKNLYQEMIIQETMYRELVKQQWGFVQP
jgi:hypothetical protein